MKWIASYIEAVKQGLPAHMRDEVAEELSSNIQSAQQEQVEMLGRELNEAEIVKLLSSFGHPENIANKYGGRDALIGSDWFGVYKKVLLFMLMLVVTFYVVSAALVLLAGNQVMLWQLGKNMVHEIFHTGVIIAAAITIAFYYLDGSSLGTRLLDSWHIDALPSVNKSWIYIPLSSTFKHLGFSLLVLILLNGHIGLASMLIKEGGGGVVAVSETIAYLLPWICAGLLAFIVLNVMNLFVPYWNRIRLIFNTGVMMYMAVLLIIVFFNESILVVTTNEMSISVINSASSGDMDITARIIIAIFVVVMTYQSVVNMYRLKTFYR